MNFCFLYELYWLSRRLFLFLSFFLSFFISLISRNDEKDMRDGKISSSILGISAQDYVASYMFRIADVVI